jgi:16S rRNA G966 N2-methylase RsmD
MESNIEKLKELKNEFINTIESAAKKKLTSDNIIVFNDPVYYADDTYENDDCIDAMALGDNGEEIVIIQETDERGNLTDLNADMLAEIADIMVTQNYELSE